MTTTMAASEINDNVLFVDGDVDIETGPKASATVSVNNPTFTNIPGLTTDEVNELVRGVATALGDNPAAHTAVVHLVAGLRRGHEKARLRPQKSTITLGELAVNDPLLEGYDEAVKTIIVSEFNKIDSNMDGKIDRREIVQFAGNTATRSLASASRIKSLRRAVLGLLGGGAFLAAVVFALAVAAAFFAKDTGVGAGDVLTARGSGGPVRTAPVTTDVRAFAPHEATDAAAAPVEAGTKSLGCIAGDEVGAVAADSLRSPVLLTSPDGSVHKLEGHDLEWDGEGGVSIRESSGLAYTIKKDPACAASSEGRRLATVDLSAFRVTVRDGVCDINGTAGWDNIEGTDGDDVLRGAQGIDYINGHDGNDRLYGGNDADRLSGNDGHDRLEGGNGGDTLRGGPGADTLIGQAGDDTLYGGDGDDTLKGGAGADFLRGGDGVDTAVFDGNMDDYHVQLKFFQTTSAISLFVSKDGLENALDGIEILQFHDKTCTVRAESDPPSSLPRVVYAEDDLWEGGACQLRAPAPLPTPPPMPLPTLQPPPALQPTPPPALQPTPKPTQPSRRRTLQH